MTFSLIYNFALNLPLKCKFPTNTMKAANGIYYAACSLQMLLKQIIILYYHMPSLLSAGPSLCNAGSALPTSMLQRQHHPPTFPNMVCNLPTLVCRYLILYFQHPTTVKNHLHFHTFLPKALHNPNKCLTFAAPEPAKPLNDAQMSGSFFICTYGKQDNTRKSTLIHTHRHGY